MKLIIPRNDEWLSTVDYDRDEDWVLGGIAIALDGLDTPIYWLEYVKEDGNKWYGCIYKCLEGGFTSTWGYSDIPLEQAIEHANSYEPDWYMGLADIRKTCETNTNVWGHPIDPNEFEDIYHGEITADTEDEVRNYLREKLIEWYIKEV